MTLAVLHTQLGFPAHLASKQIIIPDSPDAQSIFGDRIFTLFNQSELSKYPLNHVHSTQDHHRASLVRRDGDFGVHYLGDFSHITSPGVYQAYCGNVCGPAFVIHDDIYLRLIPDIIRYFQIQSCGRDVPGWHEACHLDDGYIPEEKRYLSASGGWHDAGDFRKWVTSTSMNAISLLLAHRAWAKKDGGRSIPQKLGLAPDLFLAEALQGVRYFLSMQDPAGYLCGNVGGGRDCFHDNLENRFTDNIPRSGDERRINAGAVGPAGKFTTLFALYAAACASTDPALSTECRNAALRSAAYDVQSSPPTATTLEWRAWGFLELFRHTQQAEHKSAALHALSQALELQVTTFIGGQNLVRGFFREEAGKPGFHRKHVGHEYIYLVIAEFLLAFPGHPDAPRWKDALSMWIDDYVLVFARRNPFGILPYALYESPPADHPDYHYRSLGEGLCFRYFMANKSGTTSAHFALAAAAIAAASRALNRPELRTTAYRLLEWILGNNPFQLSLMTGVGVRQASPHSLLIGPIPGGVMNGIQGDRNDSPALTAPIWSCASGPYEYYGYNTSQFLWALVNLEN